ncbi:hypothetical protein IIDPJIOB_00641 [Aeromonas veronii]
MPDYLGGLQSALLNQDATLFRRKYFLNGAHMGFIFYATDPNMDDDTEEEMKEMIASSKGVGNFRSVFVNIPDGKPDGIKLILVGDIATKDECAAIKGITAQDVLTAHRFPARSPVSSRPMAGEGSGIPRSRMPPMPATRCCRCASLSRMPSTVRDSRLPAGRFSGENRFNCINKLCWLWQDRLLI